MGPLTKNAPEEGRTEKDDHKFPSCDWPAFQGPDSHRILHGKCHGTEIIPYFYLD